MSYSWPGSSSCLHGRPANDDPTMSTGGGGEPGQGWMPQAQEAEHHKALHESHPIIPTQRQLGPLLSAGPSARYSGPANDYRLREDYIPPQQYNLVYNAPLAPSSLNKQGQGLISHEQVPPSLSSFASDLSPEPGVFYPASVPVAPPPEPITSLPQIPPFESADTSLGRF